ncbi:MAG TPA: hypothetical protein VKB84_13805 [Candidatus Binataceae bacterium]|jgi:hypothetical protein|nr:hypothetical protein [Candidatus Binataceae bacterium]
MRDFIGKVTKKSFGKGSKSEHNAVYLETDTGDFVLRRQGGNPFRDPQLEQLVGKTIHCRGEARGYTLVITDWSEPQASSEKSTARNRE